MKKGQTGEALLIIVLVMAVALTIGLAVATRSLTNIKISTTQEESARAFSAAEAGIEEALKTRVWTGTLPVTVGDPTSGQITAHVTAEDQGAGTEFDFEGEKFNQGETQTFWLVEHDGESLDPDNAYGGSQIELYWGEENTPAGGGGCASGNTVPALEAMVFYYYSGEFKVARYALDPDSLRASCNGFDSDNIGTAGYTVGEERFAFRKAVNLPAGTMYALRLKLLYNDNTPHGLGVKAVEADFPSQGKCYVSTAAVGGSTRKVQHCQSHKTPPIIFDYGLYSEGNLIQE